MRPILGMLFSIAACAPHGTPAPGPGMVYVSVLDRFDSVPIPPLRVAPESSRLDSIRASNLAPRTWGIRNAPPCRLPRMVDTTGWVPAAAVEVRHPITIPPSYHHDSAWVGVHGGSRWGDGTGFLLLENGWWGPDVRGGFLRARRVTTPDGDYLVGITIGDGTYFMRAFPADTVWRPSIAFAAWGRDSMGLAIGWTVLRTITSKARIGYWLAGE